MKDLLQYFQKAKKSSFHRWVLNIVLWKMVPFNKPHRIKVVEILEDGLVLEAPYVTSNKNHIKGIHACLLATLCEYVIGLNLMLHISPKEYRIILKSIQMVYHYQAKTSVRIKWGISKEVLENEIMGPLRTEGVIFKEFIAEVYDLNGNHICTGSVNWQLKDWKKVKTKTAA